MKNIALFGGSFDPPHAGHVAIVKAALQQLDIEKLIIIPAYLNPFKSQAYASASQRLAWLEEIFANYNGVEISDFEISKNRAVPTIESVEHFAHEVGKIYLIIGADNLASLPKWHRFDALDRLVEWAVATREGIAIPPEYRRLDVNEPISSTQLRQNIEHQALPQAVAQEIAQFYKENNAKTN